MFAFCACEALIAKEAVSGTFAAYDAVKAYDALNTDIEDVWLVNITLLLFTANEPVIVTLPVNSCVLLNWDPNIVEPVT